MSSVMAFLEALNGDKGSLDAWLEVNNEAEVRAHIRAAIAESEARADADARRFAFCNAHKVFPVLGQDGGRWVMFVAITSTKRTAFFGATPAEAIDAAIAQEAEREAASAATIS